MKRIGIRCKQCQSTYDVTDFAPGSQVQCGVCSALLTVPDPARVAAKQAPVAPAAPVAPVAAAAAPPTAPVAGRERTARPGGTARRSATGVPRRGTAARRETSGAAGRDSSAGKPPSRAGSTRRNPPGVESRAEPVAEDGEPGHRYQRKQSKAGLYASLGAIVTTLIVGGLYASGVFEKPKDEGGRDDKPVVPKKSQWEEGGRAQYEKVYQDMIATLEGKVSDENVEKSAENCAAAAKWVQDNVLDNREALGVPEGDLVIWTARRDELAQRALSYDKENRPAHLILGHRLFDLDKESAPEFHKFFPEDREILEPLIAVDSWLTEEEYARHKEIEHAALAKVRESPLSGEFIEKANMVLGNFKNMDILKTKTWEYKLSERDDGGTGHFLIFGEKQEGKGFNQDLMRRGRILEREYDFLKREFFEPAGLERDESNPLVVAALKDRESYVEFTKKYYDEKIAGSTLGHYNPDTGYFIYFEGISPMQGISDDEVMLHEGAHQIEAAFCDDPMDPDSKRRPIWRVEGWADYIGSFPPADIDKKAYWEFTKPGASRMDMLGVARSGTHPVQAMVPGAKGKSLLIPVKKLLGVMSRPSMMAEVLEQLPQEVRTGLRDNPLFENFINNLMYAQGCTFCNFAYAYKDGKYRTKFQDYLNETFTGKCNTARRSRRVLAEKFGFDYEDDAAWDQLNDEYLDYLSSLGVR